MAINIPWSEKYRPKTLEGFITQDDAQRSYLQAIIDSGELQNHLMLYGIQGSGKTTLAEILISELGVDEGDLLEVDASRDNSVEYVRNVIIPFAESYPLGKFKVILMNEFDLMSASAQGTLRVIFEEAVETCRFICTGNYYNKIIPALKSRFHSIVFKAPKEDDVFVRMIEILDAEKVEYDPEALFAYVRQAYPDVRKIINNIQQNSSSGTLVNPTDGQSADWRFKLLDLLKANDIRGIQDLTAKEVGQDEIDSVYEFLYRNLKLHPAAQDQGAYDKAILVIADSIRAHAVSGAPHITLHACMIKLMMTL